MPPTITTAWTEEESAPSKVMSDRAFGFGTLLFFAVVAAALSFFSQSDKLIAVWRTGAFFDTDDAMRLVQVRALLNGQAWFDMTAKLMDPPHGVFLHWSRIVDVPLALLIKGFGLFVAVPLAETLARLVFPFALLVGLFLGMARLATILFGPSARLPAIAATLMSGNGISQFLPGRIDHHAPQIVTLVAMLCAMLTALDPAKARWTALAGVLAGLSLAISLENLPFILLLSVAITLIWIWDGAARAEALRFYGLGLGVGLPLFFAATVAPERYLLPVCDAFGAAHLGAGLIGALGCCGLALGTLQLPERWQRCVAALAVGAVAAAFVAIAYPACLHDPFRAVDPLVREIWMSTVEEALTFKRLAEQDPISAGTSLMPVVLGLVACLVAACANEGRLRRQFLLVGGLVAVGLLLALWQIRVFTSITAIALCGALYVVTSARDWSQRRGWTTITSLTLLLLFPFTATAWAIALPRILPNVSAKGMAAPTAPSETFDACLAPAAFNALRTLTPGPTMAPIDVGSFLLVHTDLSVFAAAYHRNNDGNRFDYDLMAAKPDRAEAMARTRHVAYVMTCAGLGETLDLAQRFPGGLADALVSRKTPAWLEKVDLTGTPFHVFRVLPPTR